MQEKMKTKEILETTITTRETKAEVLEATTKEETKTIEVVIKATIVNSKEKGTVKCSFFLFK